MPMPKKKLPDLSELTKEHPELTKEQSELTKDQQAIEQIDDSEFEEIEEYSPDDDNEGFIDYSKTINNDSYTDEDTEYFEESTEGYSPPQQYSNKDYHNNEEDTGESPQKKSINSILNKIKPKKSNKTNNLVAGLSKNNTLLIRNILIGIIIFILIIVSSLFIYKKFIAKKPTNKVATTQTTEQEKDSKDTTNNTAEPNKENADSSDVKMLIFNVDGDIISSDLQATLSFNKDVSGQLFVAFKNSNTDEISVCYSDESDFAENDKKVVSLSCPRKLKDGYLEADKYFIASDGKEIKKEKK